MPGLSQPAPSEVGTTGPRRMADRDLLHGLVAIPSPTGSEGEAVAFLQDEARADGLRVQADPAGNFLAEAGRGTRTILLCGHIDTVPGHIPVRIQDGELWGRGSVDAKGCLAAFYAAARRHLDDPDLRIVLAGCVDEEGQSRGAKALDRALRPEHILVGEPSGSDAITLGYKGILRGQFTAAHPLRHGGYPGLTAGDALVEWWSDVRAQLRFADGFATHSGHLDSLDAARDGLTESVAAAFQVRLPPGVEPAASRDLVAELARRHGGLATFTEMMPAAESSARTSLAASFRRAIRAVTGEQPRQKHKTGTADFNHLAGWFPGVPMVAYGPGDSHLDHTPEERLPLREFDLAVDVLDRVLADLASLPPAHQRA